MAEALPGYNAALAQALTSVPQTGSIDEVDCTAAVDRILAEPITADRDLPPFNRAQMDGYAMRAANVAAGVSMPVAGTVAAGESPDVSCPPGHCVRIATGAALPSDTDTVIQHELSDRGDPVAFSIDTIKPGHAVHPQGADAAAGDMLIEPGTRLAAHHIGIITSVGRQQVSVRAKPRAVVLSSGDELRQPGERVEPHQIRDSNRPQTCALLDRMGAKVVASEHIPDNRQMTIDAVGRHLASTDLLVTIGGVSAGERDYFPDAFAAHGVNYSVSGAAIRPGKPVRIGHVDRAGRRIMIVALPGNPVSALACGCLFVWPLIRAMNGVDTALPWWSAQLADDVQPNASRTQFRPAMIDATHQVSIPRWAGSGDLCHTALTHGLVELSAGAAVLPRGSAVRFLAWPGSEFALSSTATSNSATHG